MALHRALEQARTAASWANRQRQQRAELRLEELIKVAGIADSYEAADRQGDLAIETAFARIYQATDDEHIRDLVVQAFVAWQADERSEEAIVRGEVDASVRLMKSHNPSFIEGAFVPNGSEPVA